MTILWSCLKKRKINKGGEKYGKRGGRVPGYADGFNGEIPCNSYKADGTGSFGYIISHIKEGNKGEADYCAEW